MASMISTFATPIATAAAPITHYHPLNKTKPAAAQFAPNKINQKNTTSTIFGTTTPIISTGITMTPHPVLKKMNQTKVGAATTAQEEETQPADSDANETSVGARDVTLNGNIFNGLDGDITLELSKNWSGTFRGSIPPSVKPNEAYAGSFVHTNRENLEEGSIAALVYRVDHQAGKPIYWLFAWAIPYPGIGFLKPNHVYTRLFGTDPKQTNWDEIKKLVFQGGYSSRATTADFHASVDIGRGSLTRLEASIVVAGP